MDLWIENSKLSNFADDTQSIVISDNKEKALEITEKESSMVIPFFEGNNLVNNANKAAILYNSKGKGQEIIIDNIGGEKIKSSNTKKLLGLHVNSNLDWHTHIEKISRELKMRIGLLKRIKNRVPTDNLVMVAEAIFNSKIRYVLALNLNPVFDEED